MIKYLLFDVAGTLIDNSQWRREPAGKFYDKFVRHRKINRGDFDAAFATLIKEIEEKERAGKYTDNVDNIVERLSVLLNIKLNPDEEKTFKKDLLEIRKMSTHIFDESQTLLTRLSKDYRLYILTNARSDNARSILELFGSTVFDGVFISQEAKVRKDDGALFKVFLERSNVNPEECLMVGNEIDTDGKSRDFGIRFCYVERKAKGVESDYDIKISTLSELESAIAKLNQRKET